MTVDPLYLIARDNSEGPGRVYVTGPLFGSPAATGIFSSTKKISEASRYTAKEANDLLARGKWKSNGPAVVPVEGAVDL